MTSGKRRDTEALILGELGRSPKPLGAYDLLDRLRVHGISGPPTVYRALDKLVATGKVHRLESINAFVACRDGEPSSAGHGHAEFGTGFTICERCGTVTEFDDVSLRRRLEEQAGLTGFRPRASVIEIRGVCANCDRLTRESPATSPRLRDDAQNGVHGSSGRASAQASARAKAVRRPPS